MRASVLPRAEEGRALKLGSLQPLHPALRWWQEEKARRAAAAAAPPPPGAAPPAAPRPTALACMSLALPLPAGWQAAARR